MRPHSVSVWPIAGAGLDGTLLEGATVWVGAVADGAVLGEVLPVGPQAASTRASMRAASDPVRTMRRDPVVM
jgi:hypothetical protein